MTFRMCASWHVGPIISSPGRPGPWSGAVRAVRRYHGFRTHEPPVPGPAVIMHCSNEVKAHSWRRSCRSHHHHGRSVSAPLGRALIAVRGQRVSRSWRCASSSWRVSSYRPLRLTGRSYSKIMTAHTTPRRSNGVRVRAQNARGSRRAAAAGGSRRRNGWRWPPPFRRRLSRAVKKIWRGSRWVVRAQRMRALGARRLFLHGSRHRRHAVFDEEGIEHHQRQRSTSAPAINEPQR